MPSPGLPGPRTRGWPTFSDGKGADNVRQRGHCSAARNKPAYGLSSIPICLAIEADHPDDQASRNAFPSSSRKQMRRRQDTLHQPPW